MTSHPDWLRPHCNECAALCCVALHFDKSDMFGHDKPAGQFCKHLAPDNSCKIHSTLETQGYAGCAAFDCKGAGQRVTTAFKDKGNLDSPADQQLSMGSVFSEMLKIHKDLEMLFVCLGCTENKEIRSRLSTLIERMDIDSELKLDQSFAMVANDWRKEVAACWASLQKSPEILSELTAKLASQRSAPYVMTK